LVGLAARPLETMPCPHIHWINSVQGTRLVKCLT